MRNFQGRSAATILGFFGVLAFSGCANSYLGANPMNGSALTGNQHAAMWSDPLNDFKCPTTDNVTPVYPTVDGFSGRFTVCTSKAVASSFHITGYTDKTDEICVVPLKIGTDGMLYRYPGAGGNSTLLHTCTLLQVDGADVVFQGVDANAFFITEKTYYMQLEQCMLSGQALQCPGASNNVPGYYSYGKAPK